MKKVLMICLAIGLIGGPAMADHVGIYTDQVGATGNCSLVPTPFSPMTIYIVHQSAAGATASQFKYVNASGYSLSASVLGGYLTIGDPLVDVTVAYGACLTGAWGVYAVNGFGFPVPGQTCGLVEVLPAPGKAAVIAVDCALVERPATAGKFRFNADATCPCIEPVSTEESTWGKVKSLYR